MVKSSQRYSTDRVTFRGSDGRLHRTDVVFGARSKAEARSVEGSRQLAQELRRRRSESRRDRRGGDSPRSLRPRMKFDRIVFDRKPSTRRGTKISDRASELLRNDTQYQKDVDEMKAIMAHGSSRRSPRRSRRDPPSRGHGGGRDTRPALRRRGGRSSPRTMSDRFGSMRSQRP